MDALDFAARGFCCPMASRRKCGLFGKESWTLGLVPSSAISQIHLSRPSTRTCLLQPHHWVVGWRKWQNRYDSDFHRPPRFASLEWQAMEPGWEYCWSLHRSWVSCRKVCDSTFGSSPSSYFSTRYSAKTSTPMPTTSTSTSWTWSSSAWSGWTLSSDNQWREVLWQLIECSPARVDSPPQEDCLWTPSWNWSPWRWTWDCLEDLVSRPSKIRSLLWQSNPLASRWSTLLGRGSAQHVARSLPSRSTLQSISCSSRTSSQQPAISSSSPDRCSARTRWLLGPLIDAAGSTPWPAATGTSSLQEQMYYQCSYHPENLPARPTCHSGLVLDLQRWSNHWRCSFSIALRRQCCGTSKWSPHAWWEFTYGSSPHPFDAAREWALRGGRWHRLHAKVYARTTCQSHSSSWSTCWRSTFPNSGLHSWQHSSVHRSSTFCAHSSCYASDTSSNCQPSDLLSAAGSYCNCAAGQRGYLLVPQPCHSPHLP